MSIVIRLKPRPVLLRGNRNDATPVVELTLIISICEDAKKLKKKKKRKKDGLTNSRKRSR